MSESKQEIVKEEATKNEKSTESTNENVDGDEISLQNNLVSSLKNEEGAENVQSQISQHPNPQMQYDPQLYANQYYAQVPYQQQQQYTSFTPMTMKGQGYFPHQYYGTQGYDPQYFAQQQEYYYEYNSYQDPSQLPKTKQKHPPKAGTEGPPQKKQKGEKLQLIPEQEFMKNNPPVIVEVHLPADLETNKPLSSDKVKMKFELNATIENVKKRLSKEIGVGSSLLRVKHPTIPVLHDQHSLAFYNFANPTKLTLEIKKEKPRKPK